MMTNYEKYKKETNIIFDMNSIVAVDRGTNRLSTCRSLNCEDCLFFCKYNDDTPCTLSSVRWLFAEYTEPEVDWTKVPIDTPVLVSNDKKIWVRRHFATPALKNDDSFTVRTFADGKTEWSSTAMREEELESCERWRYAKLAEV